MSKQKREFGSSAQFLTAFLTTMTSVNVSHNKKSFLLSEMKVGCDTGLDCLFSFELKSFCIFVNIIT
jgi:hypothetical protein